MCQDRVERKIAEIQIHGPGRPDLAKETSREEGHELNFKNKLDGEVLAGRSSHGSITLL